MELNNVILILALLILVIGIIIFLFLMMVKKDAKVIYAKVIDTVYIKGSMNYLNGDRSLQYQYPIVAVMEEKKQLGIFELKKAKQSTNFELESEVPVYKIPSGVNGFTILSVKGYYFLPIRLIVLSIVLIILSRFI